MKRKCNLTCVIIPSNSHLCQGTDDVWNWEPVVHVSGPGHGSTKLEPEHEINCPLWACNITSPLSLNSSAKSSKITRFSSVPGKNISSICLDLVMELEMVTALDYTGAWESIIMHCAVCIPRLDCRGPCEIILYTRDPQSSMLEIRNLVKDSIRRVGRRNVEIFSPPWLKIKCHCWSTMEGQRCTHPQINEGC